MTHRCTELYQKFGKGATYNSEKKKLPLMMFCCTFAPNTGAKGNRPVDTWRCQAAANLNGMFMYDADELQKKHGLTAKELFEKIPQWMYDEKQTRHIMYAGMTPSGDGLRIVATCDPEKGNLADHQQWLGTILGVPCDKSVKDASRGSFMVGKDYIYYLNEKIFEYHNESYAEKYNDCYRSGQSAGSAGGGHIGGHIGGGHIGDGSPVSCPRHSENRPPEAEGNSENRPPEAEGSAPQNGAAKTDLSPLTSHHSPLEETYHDVSYQKIVDVYCARNPDYTKGDRHPHLLKMAGRLRYIVDNNPEKLKQLVRLAQYVKDWEQAEKNTKEIDDACETACQQKFYMGKPKALQEVLQRAGVKATEALDEQERQNLQDTAVKLYSRRMREVLQEPYLTVMKGVEPLNVVPAVYASGTMMCTLMTRCHYLHYTGEEQRMNPQAEIIGDPATGKSFVDQLDKIIMEPLRQADDTARKAEKRYKDEQRERQTSSKAQKGEALKRPELPIRYLTTNTSNNVFFRRLSNAKEQTAGGEELRLHLYMFDSELAAANKRNGGADWIGKRDLEVKAFHNETTGVDYANNDSINELMPVLWNSVTTGTKIALAKKFTLSNINDGLCTRVAIAPMQSNHFQMLKKADYMAMNDRRARLLSWAYEMEQLAGALPIQKLVDHTWMLCEQAAKAAEESHDLVLDTLRRRAVFYAQWFTIPVIVVRAIEKRRKLIAEGDAGGGHIGGHIGDGSSVSSPRHSKNRPLEAEGSGPTIPSVIELMEVTAKDLRMAEVIFDSIIYWQDTFFGQMLQDSWDNGEKTFVPRIRKSRNAEEYQRLPKEFKNADVVATLGLNQDAAKTQISRWEKAGYIERVKQGVYKKVLDFIV
ncbi:MAG: hypothetical protein IJS95_00510 [Prevotella sp.]|nr:hypothetical protein [Prevotella sp.]